MFIHSRNNLQLTYNFKVDYKDHSYAKTTKSILCFCHPLQKGLVDMHDQYDEEAERENGKEEEEE